RDWSSDVCSSDLAVGVDLFPVDQEIQGLLQFLFGPLLPADIVKGNVRDAEVPMLPLRSRQTDPFARAGAEIGNDRPCRDQKEDEGKRVITEIQGKQEDSDQRPGQNSPNHAPSPPLPASRGSTR